MCEEYNSILSTPTDANSNISVKPKKQPIYRSISDSKHDSNIISSYQLKPTLYNTELCDPWFDNWKNLLKMISSVSTTLNKPAKSNTAAEITKFSKVRKYQLLKYLKAKQWVANNTNTISTLLWNCWSLIDCPWLICGTGLFGLAISISAVFGTGLFSLVHFGLEIFQSDYEILHVHFLTQTCFNLQKVLFKKKTNMIQDPTL